MITLNCKLEIFDQNPRRAKITAIEAPGTDPSAEGSIVLTSDQTEAHIAEDAKTGDIVELTIDGDAIS